MTGLVEVAARALFRFNVKTQIVYLDFDNLIEENREKYLDGTRAVLTALLPHLSDESRKIIEEALGDG